MRQEWPLGHFPLLVRDPLWVQAVAQKLTGWLTRLEKDQILLAVSMDRMDCSGSYAWSLVLKSFWLVDYLLIAANPSDTVYILWCAKSQAVHNECKKVQYTLIEWSRFECGADVWDFPDSQSVDLSLNALKSPFCTSCVGHVTHPLQCIL